MKIRLKTKTGAFVRDAKIPLFNILPDTITWGDRIFVYSHPLGETRVYLESFNFVLTE